MLERWHIKRAWKWLLNCLPYILFYIGIGLYFHSFEKPPVLSAARYIDCLLDTSSLFDKTTSLHRIILAIDLELFYIKSLRFSGALEFFGPKLIMIQKMVRNAPYMRISSDDRF